MADQERFAVLTGDRNPIHMDPMAARRSPFGRCVVHGLHLVLWALDTLSRDGYLSAPIVALKTDFAQPCLVGDEARIEYQGDQGGVRRIQIRMGAATLATISVAGRALALSGEDVAPLDLPIVALPAEARPLAPSDIEGDAGAYAFPASGLAAEFPNAVREFGEPVIAGLAALSTVVGMLNPGLYSLFSSFTAIATDDIGPRLKYRADRYSEAVRQVTVRVRARGVDANVRAGARPPPIQQLSAKAARDFVAPDAYTGRRPLVVGGSRGLGEVTAKLLAAGGARPIITYATGRTDAERVAAEIIAAGGACDIMRYDVRETPGPQLAAIQGEITGAYYFATSTIYRVRRSFLDTVLLGEFMSTYVTSFANLSETLAERTPGRLRLFYPSTIAIEQAAEFKDFPEYAATKSAGETICAHLALRFPNVHVIAGRLPRIATDQTATIMPTRVAAADEVMLPFVSAVEAG